ncbi:MAG: hypothetical protein ACI85N_000636 [Gammaproteobacteria bacterium]|jgi:hypothetical protein
MAYLLITLMVNRVRLTLEVHLILEQKKGAVLSAPSSQGGRRYTTTYSIALVMP